MMRARDVAERYEVHISTVRNWVKEGIIHAVISPTGEYRFRDKDIQEFEEQNALVAVKDDDVFLTVEQASELLGVSIHTLRNYVKKGLIPKAINLPANRWRLRLSDIDDYYVKMYGEKREEES